MSLLTVHVHGLRSSPVCSPAIRFMQSGQLINDFWTSDFQKKFYRELKRILKACLIQFMNTVHHGFYVYTQR